MKYKIIKNEGSNKIRGVYKGKTAYFPKSTWNTKRATLKSTTAFGKKWYAVKSYKKLRRKTPVRYKTHRKHKRKSSSSCFGFKF